MTQAVALSRWITDTGPRPITPRQVLRKPDLPSAAEAIGVSLPTRLRTAADVPALHRPWCLALATGLLRVDDGTVSAGPATGCWPPADAEVLSAWSASLSASCAAEAGLDQDEHEEAVGDVLALLSVLQDARVPAGRALVQAVRAAARDLYDEFGLDTSFSWAADEGLLTKTAARLASFGAVSGNDVLVGGCVVTPLGRWAADRLRAALTGPGQDLTAAELVAHLASCVEDDRDEQAWDWLDAQSDPADAARRLLQVGSLMEPRLRWIAAEVVGLLGKDALPAWREMTGVPGIGPHARYALYQMDAGPEPSDAEWLWLAVESAAVALAGKGPDEAVSALWESLHGEQLPADDLDHRLAAVRASDHPSARSLAQEIADYVVSAGSASLSVHQCLQLKVTLSRWRPPIWRTVLLPATASLSTLHRVVQILYGWDGDHLHAFRVRRATYSDPSFGLEDARSEYHMAVRHALAAGGGKIVYEYDFGAGWTHEIALQNKLPRDPAAVYPVCTKFSGDSPVEYPEEELWYADKGDVAEPGPAKPEPFDLAAVNRKLAALPAAEGA
ncbi:MAG: plasmid pRiA4b ORF-3 family protein [Streptosporangiaceae bacterium]